MSPRTRLLAAAAVTGWGALAAGLVGTALPPVVVTAAASAVPLLWVRGAAPHRWVPAVVGLVCVAQATAGVPVVAAAAAGVLLLMHVVTADLAADADDASGPAVTAAVRRLLPTLAAAAGAAVLVVAGSGLVAALPGAAALRPAAPLLLLAAALLALGLASRRPAWQWTARPRGLSALTRRYLDRAAGSR